MKNKKEIETMEDAIKIATIKEVLFKNILLQYTDGNISQEKIDKVIKFINYKTTTNTSTNSLDNRINSIYKAVKKIYKEYSKLDNEGYFN